MKNQYFGDIYDYFKYSLLRQLNHYGRISTSVCWMLTENKDSREGHRVNYLREPTLWRDFDPQLYDCLRNAVLDRMERHVKVIEKSGLLSNTIFYSKLLTDPTDERSRYFEGFLKAASGRELVFFDPDNGLEVKSVKYGQKGASRYVFRSEISKSFKAGHSILIYQHMPPKPRDPLIRELASGLIREAGSELVYAFRTPRVAFFLVPQTNLVDQFDKVVDRIQTVWFDVLDTDRYPA